VTKDAAQRKQMDFLRSHQNCHCEEQQLAMTFCKEVKRMAELKQLEKLVPEAAQAVEDYGRRLLAVSEENLVSLVVYGSATGSDFIPGRSNINLLVVLKQLGFGELSAYVKLVVKGQKKRIVAPLFLTKEHIQSSLDVFPIEFWEMKDNHLIIYGEDVFENITIKPADLRLQCEREIKSRLIRIRQAYLEVGQKAAGLKGLLEDSLTSILPIIRNVIRLKGRTPAIKKDDIINELSNEFNLPVDSFRQILKLKAQKKIPGKEELEAILGDYMRQVQQLATVVDQLQVK
jgi:hypothetical protein